MDKDEIYNLLVTLMAVDSAYESGFGESFIDLEYFDRCLVALGIDKLNDIDLEGVKARLETIMGNMSDNINSKLKLNW